MHRQKRRCRNLQLWCSQSRGQLRITNMGIGAVVMLDWRAYSFGDNRDASASNSHGLVEKMRRDRISAQFATLRPNGQSGSIRKHALLRLANRSVSHLQSPVALHRRIVGCLTIQHRVERERAPPSSSTAASK
ncbi:hypothetical protein PS1_030021 [Malus domestica]